MELLVAIFFTVLFTVLAVSLWANRQAARRRLQRVAATRIERPYDPELETAMSARRDQSGSAAWPLPLRWIYDGVAQTGLPVAPGVLLAGLVLLAVGGAALAILWLPANAATAVTVSIPVVEFFWLQSKRRQRLKTLAQQIPYMLDSLKAALESGHTLLRGLQMAAENSPEPLAGELRMAIDRVRLGASLPRALETMYQRVPLDDLSFLADAVAMQEDTGSSLAQILQHVAESIRNRQRIDDQIRVLTSQSRMSAMIVTALPGVILAAFSLIRGDYVGILFHDPIGNRILEAAVAMDVMAFFIMREIARVDY